MRGSRYAGKVALVTGGASGIGRATVEGFTEEGARVVFTDVTEDAGREFEAALLADGHDALFLVSDARDEDAVAHVVATTVGRYGRLDVAVNNVGNMGAGDDIAFEIHDCDLAAWQATVDQCLTTCFLGMKYEIAHMRAHGGGAIANTSSMAGLRVTSSSSPAYTAAKAAIVHLSEYAAVTYAREGVRVNVVAPGLTATPAVTSHLSEAERAAIAAEFQPMARMMTPREQAEAFLWVCSDEASAVTGLTIPVDGGWAAR